MKPVTVVGSINIDLFSYLDRWPKVGETVKVRETAHTLGGKGANQAVAATKLGANATLIGAIGRDSFGREAADQLDAFEVKTDLIEKPDCMTGMAFIDVGPDGDNMIRLSGGANDQLAPADLEVFANQLSDGGVVLLQNEINLETSLKAAELARKAGALVIMDPAPAPTPAWPKSTVTAFDVLTPNASEAGALLGHIPVSLEEAQNGAQRLCSYGLRGVIITMGENGVAWCFEGETGKLPAPKVNAIDTVAAGDCFNGALATALAKGDKLQDAIHFAMRAAALATTRKGASSSLPNLAELEQLPISEFA
ncbi:ribokinase [Labrenzia sp. PHM005]|uniref:ribokinase n=1 Tax=Labrenzia sp. PHM005 TaxID=2590016 RepID=UPI0011407657|nr:ribokinase [Labrenzia sp. PHM005]QDG76009.1 ribokinase [Labrenzia sp. PHM005]